MSISYEMLNYKTANEVLRPDEYNKGQNTLRTAWEYIEYTARRKHSIARDIKDGYHIDMIKSILNDVPAGTLIVVDGESGAGKTTFAKKVCERYKFTLCDIDEELKMLLSTYKCKHGDFDGNLDEFSDKLISSNLEQIIRKKSNNGKQNIVLVGCFIDYVHRCIISNILGKVFKCVWSITIHSSNLEDNLKRLKSREKEGYALGYEQQAKDTFKKLKFVSEDKNYFGIGYDVNWWMTPEIAQSI